MDTGGMSYSLKADYRRGEISEPVETTVQVCVMVQVATMTDPVDVAVPVHDMVIPVAVAPVAVVRTVQVPTSVQVHAIVDPVAITGRFFLFLFFTLQADPLMMK